ncbi:MAG: hypothetical protein R3E32_14635 [Chitinophagales bacterium]
MIFQQFFKILSDPFFWILTVIFCGIGFVVYRYFVVGDMGYDEEQAYLDTQLKYYDFKYVEAERQPVYEKEAVHYNVKATRNEDGKEVNFTARIEYENAEISAVQWEPSFGEV